MICVQPTRQKHDGFSAPRHLQPLSALPSTPNSTPPPPLALPLQPHHSHSPCSWRPLRCPPSLGRTAEGGGGAVGEGEARCLCRLTLRATMRPTTIIRHQAVVVDARALVHQAPAHTCCPGLTHPIIPYLALLRVAVGLGAGEQRLLGCLHVLGLPLPRLQDGVLCAGFVCADTLGCGTPLTSVQCMEKT